MKRKYVVVEDHDGSGMFCLGVFNDYRTAIGEIMNSIWQFQESYKKEGDIFKYTEPYVMEGDAGEAIEITFKAYCWKEEMKHYCYVLYLDEEEERERNETD